MSRRTGGDQVCTGEERHSAEDLSGVPHGPSSMWDDNFLFFAGL